MTAIHKFVCEQILINSSHYPFMLLATAKLSYTLVSTIYFSGANAVIDKNYS